MKYLLGLILLISVSASAQYSPTAAKTRFVNGIGLGTKDTATMNAADTVAMIVGRDSLVYFRYKGYWKPLAYNSSLTGYVPYTGATSSVNLGSYNLTANKIAIGGSISAVALDVHRAGSIVARIENTNSLQDALFAYAQSAQNVWFTGIDYASGANNFGFYYTPDGTTVIRKAYFSNSGDLTANSFIKSGGTSSQFLKADGSVTTIIPSGSIDTGRAVTAIATGGSLNKVRDSLQANIVLKLNISDTATMLSGYKTYYPRAALSAGTGITYNASTGVITNSSPSTGGTVTSVATNTGSGITGGTITSSGTIAADTSVLSTKANVTASLTSKVSSVSGTSPIASSGGLTPTISISQSSGSTNGYLSSTDWNTFNNKGSGSVTSIATDATMTGGTITTSGTLKVDTFIMATRLRVQKGIDSLGAAKQGNITLTTTGTSGAATFSSNTLNIPQYQSAGTYVTSVTGTSPIVSSGGTTPAISIPAATTSVNGYLTSTDWNTFNGKQDAITNPVTGTGTTNYLPKFTGASTIGNSQVFDNGTSVGIGTITPFSTAKLQIKTTTNVNLGFQTGTLDATGFKLNAYNDAGSANIPLELNASILYFKIAEANKMTLDASGNLGLGVTPSAWNSNYKGFEVGGIGQGFMAKSGEANLYINANAYYNNSGSFIYGYTDLASLYQQFQGQHRWYTAPSGTAGNAITFTQAMTLDASGNLIVGDASTSQSAKVYISRTSGSTDFATNSTLFLNSQNESTTANLIRFNGALSKGLVFGRGINVDNFVWGFTNSTTPVMTLTASGRLLINTPNEETYQLDVNGTGRFNGSLQVGQGSGGSGTATQSLFQDTYGGNREAIYVKNTADYLIGRGSGYGFLSGAGIERGYIRWSADDASQTGYFFNLAVTNSSGTLFSALQIASTGAATFSSLSGTGSRVVVADASGTLSATTAAVTTESGTYTPTLAIVSNANSLAAFECQYMRVGNVVTVSGNVNFKATTINVISRVSMTLPVSSSFDYAYRAGGGGGAADINAAIMAGASTSLVYIDVISPNTLTNSYNFSYTYLIM